jgi:hypothetical protein
VDWKQKEAAERRQGIAAIRQWAGAAGKDTRDGFPEWCWDTGRENDCAAAHALWMASPARIEQWAERNGIFIGKGFARWYLENKRTDTFAEAYEVYRAMVLAEVEAQRTGRTGR